MAKQVVNDGDSGLVARTKINENFTELYDEVVSPVWYDDSGTIKPTGGAPVEVDDILAGNLTVDGEAKFGNVTDYTQFDSDGHMTMEGAATVFDDVNTDIQPRNTGVGRPTLLPFLGNIQEFSFAIDDFADLTPIEFLHGWKEGSEVELHLHWATDRSVSTNNVEVRWEVEYTWANSGDVFPATTTVSAQTAIPNPTSSYTHFYTSLTTFTPAGGKIGAQLCWRIKRIAVTGGKVEFTGDPFVLSIGMHYEKDTIGSNERATK